MTEVQRRANRTSVSGTSKVRQRIGSLLTPSECRNVVEGCWAQKDPNKPVLLLDRKGEQARCVGDAVPSRDKGAATINPVLPMVEGALEIIPDDGAHPEIRPHVLAKWSHSSRYTVLTPVRD